MSELAKAHDADYRAARVFKEASKALGDVIALDHRAPGTNAKAMLSEAKEALDRHHDHIISVWD